MSSTSHPNTVPISLLFSALLVADLFLGHLILLCVLILRRRSIIQTISFNFQELDSILSIHSFFYDASRANHHVRNFVSGDTIERSFNVSSGEKSECSAGMRLGWKPRLFGIFACLNGCMYCLTVLKCRF